MFRSHDEHIEPSHTFHISPFSEQIHVCALLRLSMDAPKKNLLNTSSYLVQNLSNT